MPNDSERHARHDTLLVAAFAAGDLADGERDRAGVLVAECAECRSLHDDLIAIARATAALPAAVRPRDFRIAPEQAARLRPGGWRRFVAAFASPRLAMTRQLGVGLTTLGLAGLLISSIPSLSLGGMAAGASPAPEYFSVDASQGAAPLASPAAAPAASAAPAFGPDDGQTLQGSGGVLIPEPVAPAATDAVTSENEGAGGGAQRDNAAGVDEGGGAIGPATEQGGGGSLLPVASAIVLAAGLALLLARRAARRIGAG
ncbi:MAG TPA: hypothetical protein VFO78_00255 [Candidatus Limnocylindrales bacterium]|nr:hypothetical protein [Candidatus Limnocylindrales bacterium]